MKKLTNYIIEHPILVYGFFNILTSISMFFRSHLYISRGILSPDYLAYSLLIAGISMTVISAGELYWKRIYNLFISPIVVYCILTVEYFIVEPTRGLATIWPIIGFLVFGFIASLRERSNQKLTIEFESA